MRKGVKIFLGVTSLTILAIFSWFAWFLWIGGYWENMPFVNRYSGPMRFKQFVVDSIPPYISDIRGGYSGFPQGQVTTYFSFDKPPADWSFLVGWVESANPTSEQVTILFKDELEISKVYKHREKEYSLAIDEQGRKALLYVP